MMTKKQIYAKYGIEYDTKTGKIKAPIYGYIRPLLINGNGKLGRGVYTFSMLPGNIKHLVTIDGVTTEVLGTCPVNCPGCYAQAGRYNCSNVKAANARKTTLARLFLDWCRAAILAQIEADHITICRIHAAGDFFSMEYVGMWRDVVKACPGTIFWTYTKNTEAERAFDDLDNINVVRSMIPGLGINYGHCGYIMKLYAALKALGKRVYICRCGIDKNQHCTNCHGCFENEIVLFIEHSTDYKAEADTDFPACRALIESQAAATIAAA